MTTLLFNSNYLFVLLPPEAQSVLFNRIDEIFTLQCSYNYWPVTDLLHEWGYFEFPAPTAIGAAIFQACPSLKNMDDTEEPSIKSGELYWITLHPTIPPIDPVDVLCFADSDRLFFGVAINKEEANPLSTISDNDVREAWLQVIVKNLYKYKNNEENEKEEVTAHLVIHGEPLVDWTKATVKPILTLNDRTKDCWNNIPINRGRFFES